MMFLALMFALLALAALAYQVGAAAALWFFLRRPFPEGADAAQPGISLLKPVRGWDADTSACLASFLRQDYPDIQVVFGVADPSDPALPLLRQLQADNPEVEVQSVICPQELGLNPKVSTLRQLLPLARHELIVISDSDVRVGPDLAARLAAALQKPGVGLATCLYRSGPVHTGPAALEALSISADFMPSVAMAHYVEGITFALGAVMALPRQVLEDIGGFAGIADYLADDYQLGHRVSRTGLKVQVLPYVVETLSSRETLQGYLARHLRWARTYRVCRPRGYFAYGITFALPWGLLAWLAGGLAAWGGQLALACLAVRLSVAVVAERACLQGRLPWGWFLLLPLKDMISFGLWALSFAGDTVNWRGRRYRVTPDGRLVKSEED
ncbi:MAG: glycosyltransferase [Deltaproteobacteria bacterium]|nr:glycosyltransferase [Deltaproteobacteria bacterium]